LAKIYDEKISKFQAHMEELNHQLSQMDHEHDDLKFNKIVLEDTISDLERQIEALKIDADNKDLNWKR
jgi:chromosome segregation ATPase